MPESEEEKYLQMILHGLVNYPEQVKIKKINDERGILLVIKIDKDDMGRIIGRQGNTSKAIRTLMKVHGMPKGKNISLRIEDPGETTQLE